MKWSFYFFLGTLCLSGMMQSCKSDASSGDTEKSSLKMDTPNVPMQAPNIHNKPFLAADQIKELVDKTTSIDIHFYWDSLSLSLNDPQGIKVFANEVLPLSVPNVNCISIGRIFFAAGTENLRTAEIYHDPKENCYAYGFIENDRLVYVNAMNVNTQSYLTAWLNKVRNQKLSKKEIEEGAHF